MQGTWIKDYKQQYKHGSFLDVISKFTRYGAKESPRSYSKEGLSLTIKPLFTQFMVNFVDFKVHMQYDANE